MIASHQPSSQPLDDTLDCEWTTELQAAGITDTFPAIEKGVPLIALGAIVATGIVALIAPDAGERAAPLALALLAISAIPWVRWLLKGDEGPSWQFMVVALGPIAALGIGQWFVPSLGLHGETAIPVLALTPLLLTIISVAAIERTMATWVAVGSYLAFGGPLLAGWLADRGPNLTAVLTWQVGFTLALVAGYAARLGYQASRLVAEANSELARQQAIEERRQIARDVHDVVAHTLAVTMLHITAARMAMVREQPDVAISALEEAERQGRSSLADIRGIVRLLRDDQATQPDAPQPGLADIESLVAGYRTAGLPVHLVIEPTGLVASPSAELALFRVLQEALTNAARHGNGPANVDLRATPSGIQLEVWNPAPATMSRRSRGSGLVGMHERIAAAAGSFDASLRGDQWVVRAMVPYGTAA